MTSSLLNEQLVALREVPQLLPPRRGRRVHVSTLYRWCHRGVNGRRLEAARIGGVTYTSREALARFSDPSPTGPSTVLSAQREAAIERAERLCDDAGI